MRGLLIVRHAQSTWNSEGRWQGHADPPLSPAGEEQARAAAIRLAASPPFDLVVSSDLVRAASTADLIASALGSNAERITCPGLREYDVGEWSGYTRAEIEERWPGELDRFVLREIQAPPGGEERESFERRVEAAGRSVAAHSAECRSRQVLVVAHGGVVRAFARMAGITEHRTGHLSGYAGTISDGRLRPSEPVDLLEEPTALGREPTEAEMERAGEATEI
jgi:broad specificity phosphatase PhoE